VTLDEHIKDPMVFLPELAKTSLPKDWLDLENVDSAVKERVAKEEEEQSGSGIRYLFHCHLSYLQIKRSCTEGPGGHLKQKYLSSILKVIGRNTSKVLMTVNSLTLRERHAIKRICRTNDDIWEILLGDNMLEAVDFLENAMPSNPKGKEYCCYLYKGLLQDILSKIEHAIRRITLDNIMLQEGHVLELVSLMAKKSKLGMTIIGLSNQMSSGRSWESGILGSIFSISMVLTPGRSKALFFTENPSSILISDFQTQELNASSSNKLLFNHLREIWMGLLKAGPASKHLALRWIGDCLKDNSLRSSELASMPGWEGQSNLASSGFLINLGAMLLDLCQPFCRDPHIKKLVQVNADYCQAKDGDVLEDPMACCSNGAGGKGLHMTGLETETGLVPQEGMEDEKDILLKEYGFISDIFFMTHKCLYIGLNQAHKELDRMNKELDTYRDMEKVVKEGGEVVLETTTVGQMGPVRAHVRISSVQQLNQLKDRVLTPYYCLRAAITDPKILDNLSTFSKATSMWLLHQCIGRICLNQNGNSLDLPDSPPPKLAFVPELIMHNINNYIRLARLPNPATPRDIPVLPVEFSEQVLSLLVVLMSSSWLKNPHLKAKLAKTLSLLLPHDKREDIYRSAALLQPDVDSPLLQPATAAPNTIFVNLPQKKELITAVLNVFVGIDVAEESMVFEQKFMYRYPINSILFHLFKLEEYREVVIEIADRTHKNMADQKPHLFLKFVNALVNDGTWLLDEALAAMEKIKQAVEEMNSEPWQNLPDQDKIQKRKDLEGAKKHATSLNVMSNDNLHMLKSLTKLTNQVFGHPDMVERMAVMLNYFLRSITDRKTRQQYVVKDAEQFFFHPKALIKYLCNIYYQLSTKEIFIKAIAADGRSYSPDLFKQTEVILKKVGTFDEVEKLKEMAAKVEKQFVNATITPPINDIPPEFLDPLMATLMREPVFLPSGNTVDRSTVARLMLETSQDPFNRQPFTLDMIKPNPKLQDKITKWLEEYENSGGSGMSTPSTADTDDDLVEAEVSEEVVNDVKFIQNPPVTASMSGQLLPRIRRDLLEICREAPDGIFVLPDEEDMTKIHVVITGPPDTPYEGGFFYFILHCPSNYPAGPPKATLLTTGSGRVRFNPNLYRNGKVCLSILGTWSGPGWSPALSLLSVLLSIQSLMNEKPYHNEPGLEKERNVGDSDRYNEIIRHETVRVAVIEALESPDKGMPEDLVDQIRGAAAATLKKHIETCEERSHLSGVKMQDPVMENKGIFQWQKLKQKLLDLRTQL